MIRRLRVIVGRWEVLILVYNVALARLTAARLHGPRSEYCVQMGVVLEWSSCKADEPRATSERSCGTWEREQT
jgi:hypothetical protein